jgi:ABC-2 type transport system ATP-binding protein
MVHIALENVDLTFRVKESKASLKETVVQMVTGKRRKAKTVEAIRGVDFHLREGDRLGVVGHNGAGKSSLLRLLAGVYVPTAGRFSTSGRISSLFDIGVGIEPEATGWENIYLRGYVQRQTPAEIRERADEIAAFSELGEFLEMPVRCYSSGMMVRLIFSIATAISPEILLVDEVFSAGDAGFQEKARRRMLKLLEQARIMVMASHDMLSLRQLCQTVLWLDHGQVRMIGPADEVTHAYADHMHGVAMAAAA